MRSVRGSPRRRGTYEYIDGKTRWGIVSTLYAVVEVCLTDPSGTKLLSGTDLKEGGLPLRMSLLRDDTMEEVERDDMFLFAEGAEHVTMVGSHMRFRFRQKLLSSSFGGIQFRILIKPTDLALAACKELAVMTEPISVHARRDSHRPWISSTTSSICCP